MKCLICQEELNGQQRKFCSLKCNNRNKYIKHVKSYNFKPIIQYQIDKHQKRKIQLMNMFGGSCQSCGYKKNISSICFHHIDSFKKEFSINASNLRSKKWESIVAEAQKCKMLCHNCHMEEHNADLFISNLKSNKRNINLKIQLINIFGSKCEICNYNKNYSALCFHHKNPKDKKFKLDSRTLCDYSLEERIQEANKCQILCHNCHGEHHNPKLELSKLNNPGFDQNYNDRVDLSYPVPDLEELYEKSKTKSQVALGKEYGVSNTLIRKWLSMRNH